MTQITPAYQCKERNLHGDKHDKYAKAMLQNERIEPSDTVRQTLQSYESMPPEAAGKT